MKREPWGWAPSGLVRRWNFSALDVGERIQFTVKGGHARAAVKHALAYADRSGKRFKSAFQRERATVERIA